MAKKAKKVEVPLLTLVQQQIVRRHTLLARAQKLGFFEYADQLKGVIRLLEKIVELDAKAKAPKDS